MNVIDTQQKILDAVDANFDAQLACAKDRDSEYPPARCSSQKWCGVEKL